MHSKIRMLYVCMCMCLCLCMSVYLCVTTPHSACLVTDSCVARNGGVFYKFRDRADARMYEQTRVLFVVGFGLQSYLPP
jgi:hypothetical protein